MMVTLVFLVLVGQLGVLEFVELVLQLVLDQLQLVVNALSLAELVLQLVLDDIHL